MSPDPKDSITPTPRERELMLLIARGLQNKNIAFELKISENTVRAHIGNIMRKYRLSNRTQIAIAFALHTAPLSLRRDLARADRARSDPARSDHSRSDHSRSDRHPSAPKPAQAPAQTPPVQTAPD